MGQIVGGAAKPKRCNLNKLSQLGTPAAGEYILVSYDNSMTANGQGNFDRYIMGDGRTAAAELELKYLDDSTHQYIVEEVNKAVADIQPIEITGDVTNAPDEEDLTSEKQGNTDVLKFKDKAYNAALYSGLGRVYLRKNIVTLEGTGKNILTQAMVNTANTIYHIQYDYDLNGETITLPAGCVLEFEGGSLKNGTIVGMRSSIVSPIVTIFASDITLSGTWVQNEVYPEWFGAVGDGTTDDTSALKKIIPFGAISGAPVFFSKKTYAVYNTITINQDGVTLKAQRNEWVVNISKKFDGALFNVQTQTPIRHFTLYGIVITGNDYSGSILDFHTDVTTSNRVASLYIDNCDFKKCNDSIIKLSKCWYGYIKQTIFETSMTALALYDNINCFNFIGCSFYSCTTAVKMLSECYSNCFINCTFQSTDRSFDIIQSAFGLDILNCYFEGNGTANDAIIEIVSILGLHIGSCIFTKGERDVPTHIFHIGTGRNVTIKDNYISTAFNNIVQLNGTLKQFDVQHQTLKMSNLTHASLSEGFNSHLLVYHRPDWVNGDTMGARMLYTRYSNGGLPLADLVWNGSKWVKQGELYGWEAKRSGSETDMPDQSVETQTVFNGYPFFRTDVKRTVYYDSQNSRWIDDFGNTPALRFGKTADRPTEELAKSDFGYSFYDNTIKKLLFFSYDSLIVVNMAIPKNTVQYLTNTLTEGEEYCAQMAADGSNVFGFCASNTGEDEPLIIGTGTKYTVIWNFKAPNSQEYPYIYVSNSNNPSTGQYRFYISKVTRGWTEIDGANAGVLRHGATADRPSSTEIYVGFEYFDETLGKPIYWNGTSWVDATGTAV